MTPRALINSVHQWLEEEGKTVEVVERNGDGKGDRSSCQEGQLQVLGMKTWSPVTFLVPLLGMLHTSVYIAEPWASWRQGLCTGRFHACIFPFSMVCSTREGERMLSFTSHSKTSDWAMCSQEKDLSMEGWKHRGARCWMRPQLASHLSGTASLTRLCRTCPPARVLATAEAENLGRKWKTVLEPSWDVLLNLRKHPSPPWLPGNDLCDSVLSPGFLGLRHQRSGHLAKESAVTNMGCCGLCHLWAKAAICLGSPEVSGRHEGRPIAPHNT